MKKICVLRLGHRIVRDERVSTHVGLVARAFGAQEMFYSGQHDSGLEQSIKKVCGIWGGKFRIKYTKNALEKVLEYKKSKYKIIHLTMYGIPVNKKIKKIQKYKKIMLIIGGEQVSKEFYEFSDFNISITNQPHSEISALAIMLDRLMEGNELKNSFSKKFKGKLRIEPSEKNKKILTYPNYTLPTK